MTFTDITQNSWHVRKASGMYYKTNRAFASDLQTTMLVCVYVH